MKRQLQRQQHTVKCPRDHPLHTEPAIFDSPTKASQVPSLWKSSRCRNELLEVAPSLTTKTILSIGGGVPIQRCVRAAQLAAEAQMRGCDLALDLLDSDMAV